MAVFHGSCALGVLRSGSTTSGMLSCNLMLVTQYC
jgi:hypothetical protein